MTVDRIRQEPVIKHETEAILQRKRHRGHGQAGPIYLAQSATMQGAIFTNRRRLRLAEPAPDPDVRLVRQETSEGGDRPGVDEVEAVRPDLAALVRRRPASGAADRRLYQPTMRSGADRTVREFVSEFRGLSGTAKQKARARRDRAAREPLLDLVAGDELDRELIGKLLAAMQANSKPVKPTARHHRPRPFPAALRGVGCEMESFDYQMVKDTTDGVPWVVETAFGWCPESMSGAWSPASTGRPASSIRSANLGQVGQSLDTILTQQRADADEPVILVLHMACPRVRVHGPRQVSCGGDDMKATSNHRRRSGRHQEVDEAAQGRGAHGVGRSQPAATP